jgi:CRP-like cAMP-binding protein
MEKAKPMLLKPTVEMLKEIKLLKCFTDSELAKLLPLGMSGTVEAHENIIIEGELTWGLYLLLDGAVGIFKINKLTGESYDVCQLGAGSFFGEMSLIDENPRSATVKALVDSQLFYLSKESFTKFLSQSTDTRLRFLDSCVKSLVGRLRELDDNYVISQYQLWKTALRKEAA